MARPEVKWQQGAPLPDKVGLAGPYAGITNGILVVAGGANFPDKPLWEGGKKVWHTAAYVLKEPNGKWQSGFELPRAMAYGVSVSTDKGLICIGGSDAARHYADVQVLTWGDGHLACHALASLPRPVANACGALLGNTVYVAGGEEMPGATNALKTFWALDLNSSHPVWKELAPWPGTARTLATAAAQDGAFYLVGGVELSAGTDGKPARRYLRDGYRYTPAEGWRQIADLPNPVCAAPTPAPSAGSGFLIVGGDDGSLGAFQPIAKHPGFPKRLLRYDTAANQWANAGELPAPRVTVPVVRWNEYYVIPSGEVRPGVRSPEVWMFTIAGSATNRD